MRILFLSQLLPLPLDAGPKIRAYYVLRHLAAAGHEVTLVCFVRPTDRARDIAALAGFCRSVEPVPLLRSRWRDVRDGARSLMSAAPFLILRDRVPAMHERVTRCLAERSFDAVHADQLWMAAYCPQASGPLTVLDQHNAVFRVPERLALNRRNPAVRALLSREAAKLRTFERRMVGSFDRVVWVSEEDRDAFPGVKDDGHARDVIPIAVDPLERVPVRRDRPFRVTFLGGIHWPPNAEGVRWFAEEAWPHVAAVVPDCNFTIIGRGAPGPLGPAGARARVTVTGYVADIAPYLAETAVFVVPLRTGAGMRVKILDAWCWGLPVVSTTIGAEGISARDGENLLIADDGKAFAERVVAVLQGAPLARRLAENGRATVEARYDWRQVYQAWNGIYQ